MGPWIETDTDTDTQTQSTSRPILILIPWNCTGTDTDTDTLLNKNSAKTLQKMLRPLDRYRYWYRDSRNHWIETDTDTSCLGIGTFDTIPIFPSVSAIEHFFFFLGRKVGVPPPKAVSAAKVNNHHLKTFYCHVDTVKASLSLKTTTTCRCIYWHQSLSLLR